LPAYRRTEGPSSDFVGIIENKRGRGFFQPALKQPPFERNKQQEAEQGSPGGNVG